MIIESKERDLLVFLNRNLIKYDLIYKDLDFFIKSLIFIINLIY